MSNQAFATPQDALAFSDFSIVDGGVDLIRKFAG